MKRLTAAALLIMIALSVRVRKTNKNWHYVFIIMTIVGGLSGLIYETNTYIDCRFIYLVDLPCEIERRACASALTQ